MPNIIPTIAIMLGTTATMVGIENVTVVIVTCGIVIIVIVIVTTADAMTASEAGRTAGSN
jgi:hypothetical protein